MAYAMTAETTSYVKDANALFDYVQRNDLASGAEYAISIQCRKCDRIESFDHGSPHDPGEPWDDYGECGGCGRNDMLQVIECYVTHRGRIISIEAPLVMCLEVIRYEARRVAHGEIDMVDGMQSILDMSKHVIGRLEA